MIIFCYFGIVVAFRLQFGSMELLSGGLQKLHAQSRLGLDWTKQHRLKFHCEEIIQL